MNIDIINDLEKRIYELEKKQELLLLGLDKLFQKENIDIEETLELFCIYSRFSHEEFESFKEFLVESSIGLNNKNLNKQQFIENFNNKFPIRKLLLNKLMYIISKSDEFEDLCNMFLEKNC